MNIDLNPKGGGVLIEATEYELSGLAETIETAVNTGLAEGSILTHEGVETMTIRCLGDDDAA